MKPTRARHVLANTLAGLLLGVGVSLMTLSAVVSWSMGTPDLIIVGGVVIGLRDGPAAGPNSSISDSRSTVACGAVHPPGEPEPFPQRRVN